MKAAGAEALEAAFDRVRLAAMHAALEAIITVDEQQTIVMINPAAQRLFAVGADDALGAKLERFIPERLRSRHARHFESFAEARRDELTMSARGPLQGLRANGEEFMLEAAVSRADSVDSSGRRAYFTVLMRDVSHELGLKTALDDYRRQMRAIFDVAPIAIWIADGERISYANRACASLFGVADSRDLVGRSIYDMLGPQSRAKLQSQVAHALATGVTPPAVRERIQLADGTQRQVEIAVASLPDHGRTTVQMVINDVTAQLAEQEALDRSRRQLRQLASSQVQAREEERRHIARELHDELGQRLSAIKMGLSSLGSTTSAPGLDAHVVDVLQMVDETMTSVRNIAKNLRPAMLDDLGLNAAIEWLAGDVGRRLGIEVTLQLEEDEPVLGDPVAIALYRMVQESLTNVARHASATRVHIRLQTNAHDIRLTVEDNGVGFDSHALDLDGGHGLVGMRERAYMLGGDMTVGNRPEGGVAVQVRLPLPPGPAP